MEEKLVTISLKLANLNLVLHALAQRPYGEVAQVIAEVQQQASAQLQPEPSEGPAQE